jgi:hypothetical protein
VSAFDLRERSAILAQENRTSRRVGPVDRCGSRVAELFGPVGSAYKECMRLKIITGRVKRTTAKAQALNFKDAGSAATGSAWLAEACEEPVSKSATKADAIIAQARLRRMGSPGPGDTPKQFRSDYHRV